MKAFIAFAGLALALAATNAASAQDHKIEEFFGKYVGRTVSAVGEGLSQRDLNVEIKKHKNGFTLDWSTVSRRDDGTTRSKSYSINFVPTKREGIFGSAMRNNVFGGAEPLDPLKGDPYVWAGIRGDTLIVHAMLITDDGGYEMQVYERTLTPEGLFLKFWRNRDGVQSRYVTGTLTRVSK